MASNVSFSSDGDSDVAPSAQVDPQSDAVPKSSEGLTSVSQKGRRMLDTVNRLLDTGVQLDIDVPLIAVIGSQSAGKSSLIEAISGVTLPRSSGTCTRCPTECRLKHSQKPWQCRVSLRIITDSSGQTLGQARVEGFGDIIYDKSHVTDRVRRAQRAILNPHIPRSKFLEEDEEESTGSTFSANCVALEISGNNVADLSFVDLPGLIRSTADGSTNDIEVIERMVESYIKKPSCVILLTVSCETDFMNQGALQIARKYDKDGERTVGVLTKPDRIGRGDEKDWLGFIRGQTQQLKNGWFCVRQPGTEELKKGITWEMARKAENHFFSVTSPWCDVEPTYTKYLRTPNLVNRLSVLLSDLIAKRLPEIKNELDQAIRKARESLQKLPKEPSKDPVKEISAMIFAFVDDVKRHVEGTPTGDGLLQAIRPFQEHFRKQIRHTAPNFKPYERESDVNEGSKDGLPDFIAHEEADSADDNGLAPRNASQSELSAIYIEEVLERAQDARTRELPNNHPYVVEESFVKEITRQWAYPAKDLCEEVYQIMLKHIATLVNKHFAEFGQGSLERTVQHITQEYLQARFDATDEKLDWLSNLEERPFTANTHYFTDYREKFFVFYQKERLNRKGIRSAAAPPQENGNTNDVNTALASLAKLGYTGLKASDLDKLRGMDEMEPALTIMAEVRAYFQVAYKRFIDMVPLVIDHELVRAAGRDIRQMLFDRLKILDNEEGRVICQEFAQDIPQIADQREELSKKLERLYSARQELTHLY